PAPRVISSVILLWCEGKDVRARRILEDEADDSQASEEDDDEEEERDQEKSEEEPPCPLVCERKIIGKIEAMTATEGAPLALGGSKLVDGENSLHLDCFVPDETTHEDSKLRLVENRKDQLGVSKESTGEDSASSEDKNKGEDGNHGKAEKCDGAPVAQYSDSGDAAFLVSLCFGWSFGVLASSGRCKAAPTGFEKGKKSILDAECNLGPKENLPEAYDGFFGPAPRVFDDKPQPLTEANLGSIVGQKGNKVGMPSNTKSWVNIAASSGKDNDHKDARSKSKAGFPRLNL
ncbi:hypothetical protein U1Q18_017852, partial [Sarracenia purpurea var. burkii]